MQNCVMAYLLCSGTQNASVSVAKATEACSGLIKVAGHCTLLTQTTQFAQELQRSCPRLWIKNTKNSFAWMANHRSVLFVCGSSSPMTLKECLDECMEALDLFLNNHFSQSLERLRPR